MGSRQIWIFFVGDHDPSGIALEQWAQRGNGENGNRRTEGLFELLANKFGWTPKEYDRQIRWQRITVTQDDFHDPRLAEYRISIKDAGRDPETGKCLKGHDPRAAVYKSKFGDMCLEAEALEVLKDGEIAERLDRAIQAAIDMDAWEASERKQEQEIKQWLRTHPAA